MFIQGIGTATPQKRYTQLECWKVLEPSKEYHVMSPRSRALMRKILTGNSGVQSRHLALNSLEEVFHINPDILHTRFIQHAPELAARAATEALQRSSVTPEEIDALLVSTCTGYLCPGL